jgi:hypothetical protein
MRLLILAALSTLAAPAWAQEQACAAIGDIEAKLAAEYRETRVQQGVVGEGRAMLVIFAAPDGATWTAVMVRPDGVGCMAAAGSDWQARHDQPAPAEEGL